MTAIFPIQYRKLCLGHPNSQPRAEEQQVGRHSVLTARTTEANQTPLALLRNDAYTTEHKPNRGTRR